MVSLHSQLVLVVGHFSGSRHASVLVVADAVAVRIQNAISVAVAGERRQGASAITGSLRNAGAVAHAALVQHAVARDDHFATGKVP